ncbi:MAG: RDD family protein [Spartobacteria bacterium]
MQIFLMREGERTGPFELAEVNRQLATGVLNPTDLAWSEASPGWKPLASFTGVMMPGAASSTTMSVAMATPPTSVAVRYAGFWLRFFAYLIDAAILCVPIWILRMGLPRLGLASFFVAAGLFIEFVYFAGFWASEMQATPGQKIFHLRVINAIDADQISFSRGLLRVVGMLLCSATLGIGYLMVAFTERKRGLHDMIAGTYVIRDE